MFVINAFCKETMKNIGHIKAIELFMLSIENDCTILKMNTKTEKYDLGSFPHSNVDLLLIEV